MRCKYPDRDLSQRLDQTICRYENFPYFIRYAGAGTLHLYYLTKRGGDPVRTIDATDQKFDVSSVPLGYFQVTANRVAYATRRPHRMYKQGLSPDSVTMSYLPGSQAMMAGLYCQGMEDMILGKYPDLDRAMRFLRESSQDTEIAISRDTALKWNSNLKLIFVYFKGDEVGWIAPGTNTVIVKSYELGWVVSVHLSGFKWEVQ